MFKHPLFLKRKQFGSPRDRIKSLCSTTLFFISGALIGGCVYATCMKGIGMGSSPQMAQLFPLIGITTYAILIMVITENQKEQKKLIISIVSTILMIIAFITSIVMENY